VIAIPAVDLKGGRCVQLVGGRPDDERVSLPDPVAVARRWYETGFEVLHIVDLDAALGSGDNRELALRVAKDSPAEVQVGGGVRSDAAADAILTGAVQRIIVGTRAVEDPTWLAALAERHPHRVMVAADIRDGVVLRRGWTEGSDLEVTAFVAGLAEIPLAGVLCTDVGREGRMEGIDRTGTTRVVAASPHPVYISGGVTTVDDLAALEEVGAAGAVLGMALYTDTLDADEVARRWGARPGEGAGTASPAHGNDPNPRPT
jgi:phosphoribosylformimino-5-aminoimidazole carboxamide ribotide isomerase